MLEFRVLGPLQVVKEGRLLPLGGLKQRGLLALLLLDRNRVVPRDRLVDVLWGESPPASAANSTQIYVSKLRRLLGDGETAGAGAIVTEPPGYRLRVPPGELDADRFERLIAEGSEALRAGEAERARETFADALTLWHGPPFADFTAEPFAQAEIARLEQLRLWALEQRNEAQLSLGRHAEVLAELPTLIDKHPLEEALRAQLIVALYRSGRQADALAAYQDFRRLSRRRARPRPRPRPARDRTKSPPPRPLSRRTGRPRSGRRATVRSHRLNPRRRGSRADEPARSADAVDRARTGAPGGGWTPARAPARHPDRPRRLGKDPPRASARGRRGRGLPRRRRLGPAAGAPRPRTGRADDRAGTRDRRDTHRRRRGTTPAARPRQLRAAARLRVQGRDPIRTASRT